MKDADDKIEKNILKLLEKDFEQIIEELSSDPAMVEFKRNYEKMYEALKTSHERETELLTECDQLTTHVSENAGKIKEVLSIASQDSGVIVKLKNDLNEAKQVLKQLKERDKQSQSKIEALSKVLASLKVVTEQHHKANAGKIADFEKLVEEQKQVEGSEEIEAILSIAVIGIEVRRQENEEVEKERETVVRGN